MEIIRDKLYKTEVKSVFIEDENSNNEEIYFSDIEKICSKNNQNDINYIHRIKKNIKELFYDKAPLFILLSILYSILQAINLFVSNSILEVSINLIEFTLILFLIIIVLISILAFIVGLFMMKIKDIFNITDKYIKNKYYIEVDETAWIFLNKRIKNYINERLEYKGRLSNKLLNIDDYEKKDFKREMAKWEEKNENILENISNILNKILIKFNLELTKIDETQKSYDDLIFKDLSNQNILNYNSLSTGTKNLIATFIPLKIHNPKDSIILIDEPENSFYPDIQRELTDLYMNVGENNQLIMATHSPLIASSFEPWEVVELKFDENNQIYRELYYDYKHCENHVDNYTLDPRMLTWTSILTDIFDLKEDSNLSFREQKLMEYAMLKAEIKLMKNEKERENKIDELMKFSGLLGLQN